VVCRFEKGIDTVEELAESHMEWGEIVRWLSEDRNRF
jgi:hypothetical protein